MIVSQTFLAFGDPDPFEECWLGIVEYPSAGICLMFFLMIRFEGTPFGVGEEHRGKVPGSSHHRVPASNTVDVDFDKLAGVAFVKFLHHKVVLFPLSILSYLEKCYYVQPKLK